MKDSYLDLELDVKHKSGNALYANGGRIALVKLGPLAFFKKHKVTRFHGKNAAIIENANIACLMYNLLESSTDIDHLARDLFRSIGVCEKEIPNLKKTERKNQIRVP